MSVNHLGGNIENAIILEEHDGLNNAKRVTIGAASVSIPVTFSGNVTLDPGSRTQIAGNLTLSDSKGYIGLVTVTQASSARTITGNLTLSDSKTGIGLVTIFGGNVGISGNVTLSDSKGYIGLVTVTQASSARTITGNMTLDAGSRVGVLGNLTLSDSKGFIGLTTAVIGNNPVLGAGNNNIGDVDIASMSGNVTLNTSPNFIGLVTVVQSSSARSLTGNVTLDAGSRVGVLGNLTLSDAKTYVGLTTTTLGIGTQFIGLVTVVQSSSARTITGNVTLDAGSRVGVLGNVTLSDAKTFIGLTTTVGGAGDRFIGLVTAWSRNAGTTKTLITKTIAFAQSSVATIAVATNTFYITQLLINSNATARVNIKSGVTYITGNVSLGVTLLPGGGWVESGSPDSPVYIGLNTAQAIVVEKLDLTGTAAQISGKLIYFDE